MAVNHKCPKCPDSLKYIFVQPPTNKPQVAHGSVVAPDPFKYFSRYYQLCFVLFFEAYTLLDNHSGGLYWMGGIVAKPREAKDLPRELRYIIFEYAQPQFVNHIYKVGSQSGRWNGFVCLYDDGVYQFSGDYSEGTLWMIMKESGTYLLEALPSGQKVVHVTTDFAMNNSYRRTQACSKSVRNFTLSYPGTMGVEEFVFDSLSFVYQPYDPSERTDFGSNVPSRFAPLQVVVAPKDEIVCFNQQARVTLANGDTMLAKDLRVGMRVRCRAVTFTEDGETMLKEEGLEEEATIERVIHSPQLGPLPLVQLSDELWTTPCHPVFVEEKGQQGRWMHPEELFSHKPAYVEGLISLALSRHHNVQVEGVWLACLGANVGARLRSRRPDLDLQFGTGYI